MKSERRALDIISKRQNSRGIVITILMLSLGVAGLGSANATEVAGEVCEGDRRDLAALLKIIDNKKHIVDSYNPYGNPPIHVNKQGYVKLKIKNDKPDQIMMKMKSSTGEDLKQKVSGTGSFSNDTLGDTLTVEAKTVVDQSNKPADEHEYKFIFFIPCEGHGLGKGSFYFDFSDIDEDGNRTVTKQMSVEGGPGSLTGHGRGTGGGQNP